MKQHKWHKEIKAWADGAEIQYRDGYVWHDINGSIDWGDSYLEYRIKPQPKESRIIREMKEAMEDLRKSLEREQQPKEPQYLYIWEMAGVIYLTKHKHEGKNYAFIGKIKLETE